MRPGETLAGYLEVPHTADWALQVWAATPAGLLEMAARGMFSLMDLQIGPGPRQERTLTLQAADLESLLVSFLAELLYWNEDEKLAFDEFELTLEGLSLQAVCRGGQVGRQRKEIKAVTYHNLRIALSPAGLQTVIVFDV